MALPILAILLIAAQLAASVPLTDVPELGSPCGAQFGDCPSASITCIPLSPNCTDFSSCSGTCQDLSSSAAAAPQQIYTRCGGWYLMDDCDERIERCVTDPRNNDRCGPECDGMGICAPIVDVCEGESGRSCAADKVCFGGDVVPDDMGLNTMGTGRWCVEDGSGVKGKFACGGVCLPLRFGSDSYAKSRAVEVIRTDQDGNQRDLGQH